jgi:hypothetical protein
VPAKYAVLVEEGDSFLPQVDDEKQTVTVRHAGEGKSMQAIPKKAKAKKAKAEGA